MFNIGDIAVYPAHGVGVIEAVESKVIGGVERTFYVMRLLESNLTVLVPKDNAEKVGLRGLISKEEASKVYEILSQKSVSYSSQTWNRRYREYMDKLKSGSIYDVAAVLRDLHLVSKQKPLSFGERKLYDTAKNLLIKELALAEGTKEEEVEKKIQEILG